MLTITIATTGRPKKLNDCLNSIGSMPDVEIRIGCRSIQDDISPDIIKRRPPFGFMNISISASGCSIIETQNRLAVTVNEKSDILPIPDDITFQKMAIDAALKEMDDRFPGHDGIVGFNIINLGKAASPFAVMLIGSGFFNNNLKRTMFFAGYKHFYADTELGMNAERLGKFYLCKEAEVIHFHPAAGYPADKTHREKRNEKWTHDRKIFDTRMVGK